MTARSADPPQQLLVSVAVATHERPAGLRALLDALERQTLPKDRFQVVVVDDASSAETHAVLERAVAASTFDLRVIRLDQNSGPAVARNTAWRAASARVIAFTDDDCIPTPVWLEEGLRAMRAGPCVLVGATEPEPSQRNLVDPLSRTMHVIRPDFAPTCNVFYLRDDLDEVGGFDETFRVPVGEDTDLAWRVHSALDRELRFCAPALVYHDVRVRTFAQAMKETKRWAGIPPVVARHRELARRAWYRGYFLRPSHPKVLLALLGLLVAPVFPASIILAAPWYRYRLAQGRPTRTWIKNARFAPAAFAIDLFEVWVLLHGSFVHRALIL